MGTTPSFQLRQDGGQTFVFFSHANWKERSAFMGHCSTRWTVCLMSLKNALETGKGKPYPYDIRIEHDA